MNPQIVEFALRKQRLQMRAEQQRADMLGRLEGIESVLNLVDAVRDSVSGLRQHAPLLSAGALLFVVLKPRLALRLARRAWLGWMVYRRIGHSLEPLMRILRRFGT